MSWTEVPLLAIDTETTGVDPFTDRIVSVAAVLVNPQGGVCTMVDEVIAVDVDIPEGATAIHGITTERARVDGRPVLAVLTRLASTVRNHVYTGRPVVMFNARFDWPLILTECVRNGVDMPPAVPILDPFIFDKVTDRYRRGGRKLVDVAKLHNVPLGDDAHGAAADARAAGLVMRAMVASHPNLATSTLADLHMQQVAAHEADRQRFVDWKRRNSDPQFDIPAGWPIPVERAA